MIRNLQIEWMKIKNYRVFQVFSVLYTLGILLIIFIFYKIYLQLTSRLTGRDGSDLLGLFSESTIWSTVGFATSMLLYLPGMVIISLFINEVNFKTHRQNIIDGWKRETFIYTKIGLIVVISLCVMVMNFIATLVMANITNTPFNITAGLTTLVYTCIQAFVYMMFALMLATFFRRSGVAIIVFFIYGLLLEWLLMWLFYNISPGLQYFLPLQVADSLIPIYGMEGPFGSRPSDLALVIGSFVYAGLFMWLAVRKYKYDDL